MKERKSSLAILFSVIVLDLIGFGIMIPILPFYAEEYGANATTLGFLLTSYAGMQFLFSPFWGRLSDRWGRKKILLLTMTGSSLGLLILGLANSLPMLFIGRIFSGIFGANISVATAYVSDVTTEENRAKGMGLIGAAFGIGFILGPALGGILSIHSYATPILFAAGLSALNVVYAWRRLGESRSGQTRTPLGILKTLQLPAVSTLCLLNLLFTLGVTQLESTFAFFMKDRFGYDAKHVAYVLVLMALIMVLVQGGLIRRLAPRFGEKKLLISGALILALAFIFVPTSPNVAWLLFPLSIASLGRGICQPSLLSLASKSADPAIQGSVMGTFQSAASLARVIGPTVAGLLYDQNTSLPFYCAATLITATLILAAGFHPTSQTQHNPLHLQEDLSS